MGLKHVPLWRGAAYRLVTFSDTIPTRLVETSPRPWPRVHVFQHLGTAEAITVTELSSGNFVLNDCTRVQVQLA